MLHTPHSLKSSKRPKRWWMMARLVAIPPASAIISFSTTTQFATTFFGFVDCFCPRAGPGNDRDSVQSSNTHRRGGVYSFHALAVVSRP